jgi:hypothetical protein
MGLFDFISHAIIGVVVSYLSITNALATRIEDYFEPHESTDAPLIADTEITPLPPALPTPQGASPDVLRRDQNFQRAALIASRETSREYTAPDSLETTELLRDALVNIYCQYKTDDYIRTTTGTGFFVNPKGVILTNAHVAQFLLLEDSEHAPGDVECTIRSGSPAVPRYEAELLYISPSWIFENATLITEAHPRGTGEYDYALLYVSSSVDQTPLPAQFPWLPLDASLLPRSTEGSRVVIGGYPAGALLRGGADAALAPVVANSSVGSLYTFDSNFADLFALTESAVGEEGASGGPVASNNGTAIGLIVTRGDESVEGPRSLRALTISYLDRAIRNETGFSLEQNMQGDVALRGAVFKEAITPFLAERLGDALKSTNQ